MQLLLGLWALGILVGCCGIAKDPYNLAFRQQIAILQGK